MKTIAIIALAMFSAQCTSTQTVPKAPVINMPCVIPEAIDVVCSTIDSDRMYCMSQYGTDFVVYIPRVGA